MRRPGKELKVLKGKKEAKRRKDFCVCDERIGGTVGCVLKISHAQQPVRTLQGEITQPCRKKRKEKKRVTSLPGLCGSVLGGTVLRAGASGGQRGEEGGKRPLLAPSKTATAALTDRGTPPSCEREYKSEFGHTGGVFTAVHLFQQIPIWMNWFLKKKKSGSDETRRCYLGKDSGWCR